MTEPPAARASRLRLFVALELPSDVRQELGRWVRPVVAEYSGGLRALRDEALHVTLCFLGGVAADAVPGVLAAVAGVGALPAAPLALGEGLWLPRRGPRVLTVELSDLDGRLVEVQSWLSNALSDGGWYRPERRPYLPHVTVARVRHGVRVPVGPAALPALPGMQFTGSRVTLFRSRLSPAGAQYEALGSVALAG